MSNQPTSMNMRDMRNIDPSAAVMVELMKNDLLIILIERLGGKVDISVADIDNKPRGKGLGMVLSEDKKTFTFQVIENKSQTG